MNRQIAVALFRCSSRPVDRLVTRASAVLLGVQSGHVASREGEVELVGAIVVTEDTGAGSRGLEDDGLLRVIVRLRGQIGVKLLSINDERAGGHGAFGNHTC